MDDVLDVLPICFPEASSADPLSDDDGAGLYLLPAFVNHGCVSNTVRRFVHIAGSSGTEVLELRASRDLFQGDELLTTYCAATLPVWTRLEQLRAYGIVAGSYDDPRSLRELQLLNKDEAERWLSRGAKLGRQSGDASLRKKTYKGYRELREEVEKSLKDSLANRVGEEKLFAGVDEGTVYLQLCASFASVFYGEAAVLQSLGTDSAESYGTTRQNRRRTAQDFFSSQEISCRAG